MKRIRFVCFFLFVWFVCLVIWFIRSIPTTPLISFIRLLSHFIIFWGVEGGGWGGRRFSTAMLIFSFSCCCLLFLRNRRFGFGRFRPGFSFPVFVFVPLPLPLPLPPPLPFIFRLFFQQRLDEHAIDCFPPRLRFDLSQCIDGWIDLINYWFVHQLWINFMFRDWRDSCPSPFSPPFWACSSSDTTPASSMLHKK